MATFSEALKRIRLERKLTQEEFAKQLGTTKQVISRYESGQRIPKLSVASEFAKKLGVTLTEMTGDEMKPAALMGWDDPEAPAAPTHVSEEELKFALFGDDAPEVTDAQFEEVKRFAQFVMQRDGKK